MQPEMKSRPATAIAEPAISKHFQRLHSTQSDWPPPPGISWIQRRFGLNTSTAVTVAHLAGIGGAA